MSKVRPQWNGVVIEDTSHSTWTYLDPTSFESVLIGGSSRFPIKVDLVDGEVSICIAGCTRAMPVEMGNLYSKPCRRGLSRH